MFVRALAVSCLALSLCGCGAMYLEAETEELCKTIPGIEMPGAPASQMMSIDTGTDYDFGSALSSLPTNSVDGKIELLALTLKPVSGVSDLSFVQTAQVSVENANGG